MSISLPRCRLMPGPLQKLGATSSQSFGLTGPTCGILEAGGCEQDGVPTQEPLAAVHISATSLAAF